MNLVIKSRYLYVYSKEVEKNSKNFINNKTFDNLSFI